MRSVKRAPYESALDTRLKLVQGRQPGARRHAGYFAALTADVPGVPAAATSSCSMFETFDFVINPRFSVLGDAYGGHCVRLESHCPSSAVSQCR